MPVRSHRQIDRALRRKGFDRSERHHVYFFLVLDGRRTEIFTKMSHGRAEVGADLISRMARQCRLSKDEFLRLVDCPMTANEYVEILESRGHLGR